MNSTTQGVLHTISRQLLTWTNVNTQEIIREKRGYFLYKRLIDTCISLVVIMVLLSWLVPLIAPWRLSLIQEALFFCTAKGR